MTTSRRLNALLLIAASFLVLACGGKSGTVPLGTSQARPLDWAKNLHPRLLLTSGEQERLRGAITGSHKFLWERFLADLPARLEASRQPFGDEMNRGHGDLAPELCFAWAMTGSPEHFEAARDYALRLARGPEWNPADDLIHGHLLQGLALSYDLLYQSLTPEERAEVAARLGKECENEYERMTTGRVWYRNEYFQNHAHSNFCGLAFAACALYGEDERARQWLGLCEAFFDSTFAVMPPDGGSCEGLSYGSYSLEYICRYAELAKSLLGKDYYQSCDYLKHSPEFLLHSTLPVMTEAEWAMTFGDAPRHSNWHGPEPQLFLLASRYGDGAAQWLGRKLIELNPKGLGSAQWWALLWYDPAVESADPSTFPTLHHMTDLDQVMMRSSWTEQSATLVGLKSGPFMGRRMSKVTTYDWGTGHQHPDAGSFQLFSHGQFLAIDPLYTGFKRAANHNTLLVKGQGQLGDEVQWFAAAEALQFGHYPQVTAVDSCAAWDWVTAEVAPAYHPALGLKKFTRHCLLLKPDILVLADQVQLSDKGMWLTWPGDTLTAEGGLSHNEAGYVVGTQGEAWTTFRGESGSYRLYCLCLDNYPGQGEYSFVVGDSAVYTWKNTGTSTDFSLELSPPVTINKGDRVAFRGAPMAPGCRMIKMAAFSEDVPARREVEWLLHLDPKARVTAGKNGLTAVQEGAALDVHCLTPLTGDLACETWQVKKADIEPFTYRQTTRVVESPRFEGDSALIVNLIHARDADGKRLSDLKFSREGGVLRLSWKLAGQAAGLDWDLDGRRVELK